MNSLELVDELYEVFVDTLSGSLADAARKLAFTLCLAPSQNIPWSRVFGHEVTLAAPALVAEAMPHIGQSVRRDAIFAHMLAVIEAFGTDRVEDGQVQPTPELMAVLEEARFARDRALGRVAAGVIDPAIDFALADQKTAYAITAEHDLLRRSAVVTFETYERISLGKQSVGFPASIALAHAAGWSKARRSMVYRTLASVWLGLQMHDDVVDWEDDFTRGGAWAVSLALGQQSSSPSEGEADGAAPRQRVHAARTLELMLERSRRHFRATRMRAATLGMNRLSGWAAERERRLTSLVEAERRSAGYAVRAHALAPWAGEVLA
jgi:hypothetical protein